MDDLEREFSPSSRVGGSATPFVAQYEERSAAARAMLGDRVHELADGSCVAADDRSNPLLVFIHGGYWQALSAASSVYLAPGALAHGWSFAAVEYTLAPAATLAEMVRECSAALTAISAVLSPSLVVLAGHSAGAHLAAMVSLVGASPLPVARTVLVSGVFDLRPLVRTSVNDLLGMDEGVAAAVSPRLLPVVGRQDVTVAWGDNDTEAFAQQSRSYAAHLADAGVRVSSFECVGRHHFDIVDDLVDPDTELGRCTLTFG
jgi:arylformamidase